MVDYKSCLTLVYCLEAESLHCQQWLLPITCFQCCLVQNLHLTLSFRRHKTILDTKLSMYSLEIAICVLYDYMNQILLGSVLSELLSYFIIYSYFSSSVHHYMTASERKKQRQKQIARKFDNVQMFSYWRHMSLNN